MQLVERGNVIFGTLFVYDASGAPTWYVATMSPTSAELQWSGDLYATTGPWFGTTPFDPTKVVATKAGTMTWTAQTTDTGNVSYIVNGVAVTKNVTRQTLVLDDFSGHYMGGTHTEVTDCLVHSGNGTTEQSGTFEITQVAQVFTLFSSSCSYVGTVSQAGQIVSVNATFVCSDGSVGSASFSEMQVTTSGLTARFQANYSFPPGCKSTGWIGAMRGTTF